jgi:hypothetical protein
VFRALETERAEQSGEFAESAGAENREDVVFSNRTFFFKPNAIFVALYTPNV